MDRRTFAERAAGVVVGTAFASIVPRIASAHDGFRSLESRADAVLFDAFAVFDPRPVAASAERLFPGRGAELMAAWRARQFEYAWLRIVAGHYADFERCTSDALRAAAAALHLEIGADAEHALISAFHELRAWPDVAPALHELGNAGVRLGLLSNFTPAMLRGSVAASGLDGIFEQVVSTDDAQTYKPDPRAYQLGVERMRIPRERIVFVAFAGWDAAGAKLFGYPTFWVNRLGAPADLLGAPDADASDASLAGLARFVAAAR